MDNKLKIINYLGKNKEIITMRQLSQQTKIPYATFYRTIKQMNAIIKTTKAGKATMVQLNTQNPITKHYLIISSEEQKEEYLNKQPIIKKITTELPEGKYSLVLFGSYAKGTQTNKSDIDLLIINEKGERQPNFTRYEIIFKTKINPIYLTKEEFTQMLKETEENLGKQALKNNIILYNSELFWSLAYEF